MFVEPDRVPFLGDCLYDSPDGRLTSEQALPLLDAVLGFGAALYIEGHSESVISPTELEALANRVRLAESVVRESATRAETSILAQRHEQTGEEADEDLVSIVRAFIAGYPGST